NAHGRDLNRCFPERCEGGAGALGRDLPEEFDEHLDALRAGPINDTDARVVMALERAESYLRECTAESAPEAITLMRLLDETRPTAVLGLHGGALVASLPWDDRCGDPRVAVESMHPRYAAHERAAHVFADTLAGAPGLLFGGIVN